MINDPVIAAEIAALNPQYEGGSAQGPLIPAGYMEQAAVLINLPIRPEHRENVRTNIERAAIIAKPLLDFELDETYELAPVFVP